MGKVLVVGMVFLIPSIGTGADPPAWKLTEADGHKWAARIGKAVAHDNWAVEVQGNEITVRRKAAVAMARVLPNAAPNARPTPDGERTIRFALRFAPKMSADEYDRLAAVNAASEKEYDWLHRAVGLPHKFDDFVATTPDEKERVRAFRGAVGRLPRHDLPDLYAPDHSIHFLHPWDGFSFPSDDAVAAECRDVEVTLVRYFGVYDPAAAGGGRGIGKYLPEPRR